MRVRPASRAAASNALRVARLSRDRRRGLKVASAGKASVDEQRLARGRDDQCRLPALDVDEVDVEGLRRDLRRNRLAERDGQNDENAIHLSEVIKPD